ncbi:hypothetical protein V6N13_074443 [Hibiscus sabdariffa]|uniref:Uncharacterized protein n=1 Tax=Hibiscus sabdariffa TaxID=183260 RepID=A0ABR2U8S5_9ROSI
MDITSHPRVTKNTAYLKSNPEKKSKVVSHRPEQSKSVSMNVDHDVIVITQENVGKLDKHTTVTLLDKKHEKHGPFGGKVVRARSQAGRSSFDGKRRGFPLNKSSEVTSHRQPIFLDWMLNFSCQLDAPESSTRNSELGGMHDTDISVDGSFSIREHRVELTHLPKHDVPIDSIDGQKSME